MKSTFTALPSGCELNCSVLTRSPFDGAMASLSIASNIAVCAAKAWRAASVAYSASSASRLTTFPGLGASGMAPTAAFKRGSMRESELMRDMGVPSVRAARERRHPIDRHP